MVCIEGDSAFGFSGMEMETMVRYWFHDFFYKFLYKYILISRLFLSLIFKRYQLPIIVIIVNNNGIYGGLDKELFEDICEVTLKKKSTFSIENN